MQTRPVTIELKAIATIDVPVERTGQDAADYAAAILADHTCAQIDDVLWADVEQDGADADVDDGNLPASYRVDEDTVRTVEEEPCPKCENPVTIVRTSEGAGVHVRHCPLCQSNLGEA